MARSWRPYSNGRNSPCCKAYTREKISGTSFVALSHLVKRLTILKHLRDNFRLPGNPIGGSVSRALGCPVRAVFPHLHQLIRGVLFGYPVFRRLLDIAELKSLIFEAHDRRLAKTEKEHLALIPPSTRAGQDYLACWWKYSLCRRQSSGLPQQWELVDDCYVHGIKFGEAEEENLCVEMQFS